MSQKPLHNLGRAHRLMKDPEPVSVGLEDEPLAWVAKLLPDLVQLVLHLILTMGGGTHIFSLSEKKNLLFLVLFQLTLLAACI